MNTVFRALDDSTRRKILEMLREKDMTAGDIADCFAISKPSISHHLDLLRQADLIIAEKRGQFVIYSLSTTVLDDCIGWLMNLKRESRAPHEKSEKGMATNPVARRAVLRRRPALG